jgi:hypothetical protein
MFLMWGYDGETVDDIQATIEHVKKASPDVFFTTVAYPIMNTRYYGAVADRVVLSESWETSTDRDYKIRGRHSRSYYRHADRWVRNEVEAFQLESRDPAEASAKRHEAEGARLALLAAADEVEA